MSTVNSRKDLLRHKARLWVYDELAAQKKWVEYDVVDNVKINHPANPVEVKTPSGVTIYKSVDLDAFCSFDWYHPGDISKIELLFRGVVTSEAYDGSTAEGNELTEISFAAAGDAFPLPGFNGAKTAVAVDSVKSKDGVTTYTVSTDYTVAVDSVTGVTHIVQVSGGSIPLNTPVIVQSDYTPLKSTILRPNYTGVQKPRNILIDVFTDASDATKYRRYYLPNCTVTSELMHSHIEFGEDNTTPNIFPVTVECVKPDPSTSAPGWYWIDTKNVS